MAVKLFGLVKEVLTASAKQKAQHVLLMPA